MVDDIQRINLPEPTEKKEVKEKVEEKPPSSEKEKEGSLGPIKGKEEKKEKELKPKKKFKINFDKPRLSKRKFFLIPLVILLILLVFIGVPTLIFAKPFIDSAKKTYTLTQETYQEIKNQDLEKAADKLKQTEESLKETQSKYKRMALFKIVPGLSIYYNDGESALSASLSGIEAGRILIDAVAPYADVLGFKGQGSFTGGTAEDRLVKIVQTLEKVTPKLDEVSEKLQEVERELEEINPNHYPKSIKGKLIRERIIQAKTSLNETASGVDEAKPILNVLPQILGYPDSKKYLVIFQNDGELRATGGFMTAFSVLEIESGKVKPVKSDDIYSLDKKFKSRLKPPDPIKDYLFSTDLDTGIVPYFYIRDMNFSPDFKVSMDIFGEYYNKLPDEHEVEGIIAIDTYVLTSLVDVLGPVTVPGYQTFTNEPDESCHGVANIICELEYIVDQPLPTQVENRKKAILGPMVRELLLKAMGSPKALWPKLFSTGLDLLKEKHMLLYFDDQEVQQAAEVFGAAGRIEEFEGDYLHINDSNFGGAKSNLFTDHEVEQEIEIAESGRVTKTLTLTYENEEEMDNCNLERKSGLCLNSILRNYFRIYVPQGSKLLEGLGSEVEMTTGEELGKTFFDGFLNVRGEGGRAKVVVKYELPFKLNPGDNYQLLIQKQPGTAGHQYRVLFGDQEEEFDLTTDKKIEFEF